MFNFGRESQAAESAGAGPDIAFDGVSKSFLVGGLADVLRDLLGFHPRTSRVEAIREISLAVQPGKLLGVLGRNGAGKSTLLRMAAGVYHPDRGTVWLRYAPAAILEMGFCVDPRMTGRQFCDRLFNFRGVGRNKRKQLADEVREFSELEEYFERALYTYSSGMSARLFFSAATALPARIVLLDEVLCVGDAHFMGKSLRRLLNMVSHGASGLVVSHDWFTTTRICDDVVVLDHGSVQYQGPAEQAVRRYLMPAIKMTGKAVFVGKEILVARETGFCPDREFVVEFEVESQIDEAVAVGMALEIPKLALIVLIDNVRCVLQGNGCHRVKVSLPRFPVRTPKCYLSLFLSSPRVDGEASVREIYDQISWTTGDSMKLVNVEANGPGPVCCRQLSWRRVG